MLELVHSSLNVLTETWSLVSLLGGCELVIRSYISSAQKEAVENWNLWLFITLHMLCCASTVGTIKVL